MRVALCLHGNFNSNYDNNSTGYEGYKYIKKEILTQHKTDVFIHSWDIKNKDKIIELYKPVVCLFEDQKSFDDIIETNGLSDLINQSRPPATVLSHLYSVSESIKLCYKSLINYDLIIKARFDLGRINRFNTHPIISFYSFIKGNGLIYPVQTIKIINQVDKTKIYTAFWKKFNNGPADMWFYGSQEAMKIFTGLYEDLIKDFKAEGDYSLYIKKNIHESNDISNAINYYKFWFLKYNKWKDIVPIRTKWS
jgi:hypothetical protein